MQDLVIVSILAPNILSFPLLQNKGKDDITFGLKYV